MNFNSQICTTREQSERLLALGLKKETADMMFIFLVKDFRGKDVPDDEKVYSLCTWYKETSMRVGLEKRVYIPAWSLHRLIEMMPTVIPHEDYHLILGITATCVYYADDEYAETFKDFEGDLYDCVVKCIEWLIKEGYFNKEYLEEKK